MWRFVNNVDWQEGRLDEPDAWPSDIFSILVEIDRGDGNPQWRLFTVATVTQGPLCGVKAVGMGSNQKKLAYCAIVIAATRQTSQHSAAGTNHATTGGFYCNSPAALRLNHKEMNARHQAESPRNADRGSGSEHTCEAE